MCRRVLQHQKEAILLHRLLYEQNLTTGYGHGYSEVKQVVIKMMDLLKEGSTQKDVIQHLVK